MGVRTTARVGLLLAALVVITPASAVADETLQPTGSVTYTWQGDPLRGCAQVGVCGVHGALIVRPADGASLSSIPHYGSAIDFNAVLSTVRVRNGANTCIEAAGEPEAGPGLLNLRGSPRRLTASLEGTLSSGRCAGPMAQELGGLALRGRQLGRTHPAFDFRFRRAFTAGPFTGVMDSTLVLRPAPIPGFSFNGGSSGPAAVPGAGLIRLAQVTLKYRVAYSGNLDVGFAADGDPFCTALAACGARGALALTFPAGQSDLTISAWRPAAHRLSRARALRDLRSGQLTLDAATLTPTGQRVSETIAQPGSPSCIDSVATPDAAAIVLDGVPVGGALTVQLQTGDSGADPFRTHCPGPGSLDVVGQRQTLLNGTIAQRALLNRSTTVLLSGRGVFGGSGYHGSRAGTVRMTLTLLAVTTGTVVEPGP